MSFDYDKLKWVGKDVFIDEFVRIKRPEFATIGSHVAIDFGFYCTVKLTILSWVHIAPYVSVIGGADGLFNMGDFTTIAAGSRIIVRGDAHMGAGLVSPVIPEKYRDEVVGKYIGMGNFSALGTNAIIMPNTWLAEGVVVGANSLVTKPIEEPWTIWVGSPARKIKSRPREKMLKFAKELTGYDYE